MREMQILGFMKISNITNQDLIRHRVALVEVGCGQQTFDAICFRVPPCHQTLAGSGAVILESRKVCYRLGRDGVLDETGYCTIRGTGFEPVFRVYNAKIRPKNRFLHVLKTGYPFFYDSYGSIPLHPSCLCFDPGVQLCHREFSESCTSVRLATASQGRESGHL